MRIYLRQTNSIVVVVAAIWLTACVTPSEPPDPARIREELLASRADERELVEATVTDLTRRQRILLLLDERDRLIAESVTYIRRYKTEMTRLNADYGAERRQFERLIAEFNAQRAGFQVGFVEILAGMKATTTAEEWRTISKYQLKHLPLRRLTYGQAYTGQPG